MTNSNEKNTKINHLSCEIVQDLLPSYVDELTSDVSNMAIEEHLNQCEKCKATYEEMKHPQQLLEENLWEEKEVDYLKQVRKKNKKITIFSIAGAILIAIAILFVRLYVVTKPIASQSISEMKVEGDTIFVKMDSINSAEGIASIHFSQEEGVVKIEARGALVSPWNKGSKEAEYVATNEIETVYFGNQIIWDHGTYIDVYTFNLFQTAHPYIGDMTKNGETMRALDVAGILNVSETELQTTEEPYEWKMTLQKKISAEKQEEFEEQLTGYGSMLIALIDNLSEVTFEYRVANDPTSITITKEDASNWAGKDIKECGKNISDIQNLLHSISNINYYATGIETEEDNIKINITPEIEEHIASIGIHYFVDQTGYGSQNCQNADGSFLENNKKISFEFLPEDFNVDLSEASEFMFQVQLTLDNGDTYSASKVIHIVPGFGKKYSYRLTGSCKKNTLQFVQTEE